MKQRVELSFEQGEDFEGDLLTFMCPADQVAFERHYSTGIGSFQREQRVEWVLWFIWRAWKREQKSAADFDTFVGNLTAYAAPDGDADPPAPELPA